MKHFRTQVTLRIQSLLLLAALSCIISSVLRAQSTYPVQVNVYLPPPHGTYLSDYYTGTREKMVVSLLNRDMQRPSLEVFLRVTVSSASGFQVRSRLEGSYPPVTLDAGVPVRLTQDDLAPYFLPRNTTTSGGNPGGQLPEGLVEFTVEAFERYTGKALSLGATARVWLSRQKPPLLRLPSNGDNLPFREPMQLKFQWEPQHRNLSQVEYEFELRELPDNGVAPQSAFAYAPVVHGERLACTYLAYNTATMYPLSPGKTYGWRVRAVAKDGVDEVNAFDNGGYSQTCWFSTSTACDPPEGLRASLEGRSLELSWTAPADTGRYLVQLREKDAPSSEWQSATTPGTHYTARGLNRGSAYEYRVGRVCAVGGPVFTGVGEVAIPAEDSARMAHCGVPGKYDRSNREPLKELRVGDVVIAGGDYPMTVTKVTASLGNGMFAGEGWIQMKWLFDSKLAVEFSDLVINADKIQIGGVARGKQRKDESQIANLGGGKSPAAGDSVKFTGKEIGFVVPDNPTGNYDPESGQVVVYSTDGQEAGRFDVPKNEKGEAVFPVTVKDKDGKVYEIDKVNKDTSDSTNNNQGGRNLAIRNVSESSSSTAKITKLPAYIGYAFDIRAFKAYSCNSASIEESDKVAKVLSLKLNAVSIVQSCDVPVKDSIYIGWYKAEKENETIHLSKSHLTTESIYVIFKGGKEDITKQSKIIHSTDLTDTNNECEIIMEDSQTRKPTSLAKFNLVPYSEKPQGLYVMQVERAILGNPHRVDYYGNKNQVATNGDMPVKVGDELKFKVMQVQNKDTLLISNSDTKWFVNSKPKYTGGQFSYKVLEGVSSVCAKLASGDTIMLSIDPEAIEKADGRIRLVNNALLSKSDTLTARKYFNMAFSTINARIEKGDLLNFINKAPKEIVVNVVSNPAVNGVLKGGEADGRANIVLSKYDKLSLARIEKDKNNAVKDARLISYLTPRDKSFIDESIVNGKINQNTEVLLFRMARLSPKNRDTLLSMIKNKSANSAFLDSVSYEITADDNVSDWVTFFNGKAVDVNINLNDGFGGKISQNEFIRLNAHELLHHWWTYFKRFEKLKWMIIREFAGKEGYDLSDQLNNNGHCSEGSGHERYNPENEKVCSDQNNY